MVIITGVMIMISSVMIMQEALHAMIMISSVMLIIRGAIIDRESITPWFRVKDKRYHSNDLSGNSIDAEISTEAALR